MKKPIIILLLVLSSSCYANYTWKFYDYFFHVGQQYRFNHRTLYSIDLQYDRLRKSCLNNKKYLGFGANYLFNESHQEFGVKALWNPSYFFFDMHKSFKCIPYIYSEGILILDKKTNTSTEQSKYHNKAIRPGLGITGIYCKHYSYNIRTSIQLGYNLNINQNFNNGLTLDFKIGIALNPSKIKNYFRSFRKENKI